MGIEYAPAIDMFIDDPAWVFTNALAGLSGNELSIVIHKTASGGFQTATQVAEFFHADTGGHKSVHFIVGRDGSVIQVVRLQNGAGGNCCLEANHDVYWDIFKSRYGNLNRCTISIEHEDWTVNNTQTMTSEQIDASFTLVKWLVNKFNIPVSHIKGHNTLDPISRQHCPGSTYPMEQLMQELNNQPPPEDFQLEAAKLEWNSILPDTPMNTGIFGSWINGYRNGTSYGPPLCHEYHAKDWNGQPIVVQQFTRKRCEWSNGNAHWF